MEDTQGHVMAGLIRSRIEERLQAGGETEVDKDNISRKGLIFDLSNLPASRVAPIDERNNEPFIKKRLTENDGDVTREGE
ncbi:hypothetical protein PRIPAC_89160 [Pristionchus pacificus]|uniref:Uncharacterized protein n=1 Tax=Pristionchus pacificus TaxID=54126 RepID=A0A454Y1J0_PRIPA|nr:hypothetical protein PRIPAC_89160 [Pristionchus pacificus]|eukprot:PDM61656.1 hypothetical protein PRIPAC_51098 [Pristionchus pacificus]